jgi:IS605 OrfB family transposase
MCQPTRALQRGALERVDCYRKSGKTRSYFDQCQALTQCRRELLEMGVVPLRVQRWSLKRLDDAFKGFFSHLKARKGKVFAYCSDETVIPNPRIGRHAERELRRRQRALARCRRGTRRRQKVRVKVIQVYRKISNTRSTWLHQRSAELVRRADLIVVEDLKVSQMIRHPTLARSIADVSWSRFVSMLAYKAEKAGKHLIRVDPGNTTQKCSACEELVPKGLAERTHACPACGLVIDRDYNASLNILRVGTGARAHNVIDTR